MMNDFLRLDNTGAVLLKLRVHPGAKRSAFNGTFGDALKLDLQAPPVDGKANAALLKFLAEKFSLPKNAISLKSGECSRDKVIKITGASPESIIAASGMEK